MKKNNIISKGASRATSLILSFVMIIGMLLGAPANRVLAAGNTFYVDSVNGSDSNDGITSSRAWKTLDKVNSKTFNPGDTIYLVAGSSWVGQLAPKGSGTAGSPIVIDMYDPNATGIKPRIDGNGTVNDTVLFSNQEYWEINNLEITNLSPADSATEEHWGDFRGVHITGTNYGGSLHHFRLNGLYVHDVSGEDNWIGGNANGIGIHGGTGWDASKNTGG